MGDEDWDTEISGQNFSRGGGGGGGGGDSGRAGFGAAPTFQPTFPKPGGLSGRVTESSASFGQNVKPQVISGKSNGEVKRGGFGNGRPFGSRAPSGSSFGERRSSNFDREVADTEDSYSDRGVSRRSGFQSMNDESNACRGGGVFGRSGRGNFGSFTNEENEKGAGRWNSGGFGFKRGGFGSPAGDLENKGKGFQGRGGYKGSNEEIIGGSGRSTWKSDGDTEKGDCAGPKVTYVPPPPPDDEGAIFARYQTGINFDKYDKILVDVSGDNPPPAILTFEDAALCQTLTKNIDKAGYLKLTPVQKYSIPIILAGRDLMACAQTGSGKTAAFLIPILAHMMRDGITATQFKEQQEPECIIVAPTRELINQIFMETRKFLYGTCIRPVVIYGGIQVGYTIRQISQGCNILCATPGRLLDIINRGKIGLSKLKYLVLDEADRMLDMGFMPDIKTLISSPGMPPKEQRQTLMFSATFPQEIQRLAAEFLKTDYLFVVVGQVGGACSDVQQSILQVKQYDKREKLIEILRDIGNERTMVFVETKKKTDFIATTLCQEHMPATSIHGDREQREREEALCYFRLGKCPVLVATSVAARGLDIENVQHVINFDLPSTIDEYVHRIGRTGRCGNIGKAISFFDPHTDSALAQPLIKVLADAQQEVPAWLEEMACSAGGISFISSGGSTFASTDSRKAFHGKDNQHSGGFAASNISEVGESWD